MAGPPIVLVHGIASSFEHGWQQTGWVDILQEEGREIIAVDLPGHGSRSGQDPQEISSSEVVLEAVGDGPVDAVGFSAGGHAVLSAAVARPEAFRRLALLGVGSLRQTDSGTTVNPILAAMESDEEPTDQHAMVLRRLAETSGNDRHAIARFMRSGRGGDPPIDLIGQLSNPTLMVLGEEDFTGRGDELFAALPNCERLFLPRVDHFATPSDFRCIEAVVTFLSA